ncbi:MAG TPA: 4Fe-4S binding protein [Candidatus Deferrimicrobium sp.]|nr:4Fe-4S binding protein [Candidatus Deferrimicrobium sp.]
MKIEVKDLTERVPGTGDFIKIDQEKCTGCGRCIIICVMNLWKLRDGIAILDEDYHNKCLECASCYQVCESDAISFSYPAGGTGIIYKNG